MWDERDKENSLPKKEMLLCETSHNEKYSEYHETDELQSVQ